MKRAVLALAFSVTAPVIAASPDLKDLDPSLDKSYTGAVEIRRSSAPGAPLIVAIDLIERGERDGFADHAYVFYMNAPAPDLRFVAERAHVEDLGGRQLFIVAPGAQFVFTLEGEVAKRKPESATRFVDGTGLARHWGEHVKALRVADRDGATSQVGCDGEDSGACYSDWSLGGAGGGSCDVGGYPATACSASNGTFTCQVTCPTGYYACCNYGHMLKQPSCQCVKF
jgi:hypothetical protein